MALGISFIYSIMKMINWAMGEFFMIGSYVQYALIVSVLGRDRWWLAVPLAMGSVFLLAMVVGGPNQYAPPDYARPVTLGTLPLSGNRFVALVGTALLLGLFLLVI